MGNRETIIAGIAAAFIAKEAHADNLFVGDSVSDSPSIIQSDGTVETMSGLYSSRMGFVWGGKDNGDESITINYEDIGESGIGTIEGLGDPDSATLSVNIPIDEPRGFNQDPSTEGIGIASQGDDTLLFYSDPTDPSTETAFTAHQDLAPEGDKTDPTGFLFDTANNIGLTGLGDPGKWALIDSSDTLLDSGDIDGPSEPIYCPDTDIGILLGENNQRIYVFDLASRTLESTASVTNIYPEMGKCFTDPSGATTLLIAGDNLSDWTTGGVQFININSITRETTEETYVNLSPYNVTSNSLGVPNDGSNFWVAHGVTVIEGDTNTQSLTGTSFTLPHSASVIIPFNVSDAPSHDLDGDGHNSTADGGDDCNDSNASIHPDATEIYYDGTDQDCSGGSDYDQDGDGYDSSTYGGTDCNDTNASIHLGATDTWYDGIDSDCRGNDDYDADNDGFSSEIYREYLIGEGAKTTSDSFDCDDSNERVNPDATEICTDEIDNNCDDLTDSEDEESCPTDTGDDTGTDDTGDSDADTDADADTDTDTDADTDTDTDADSDADTDSDSDSDSDADTDTGTEECTPAILDGVTAPVDCAVICFDPDCDVFITNVEGGAYTYTTDPDTGSVALTLIGKSGSFSMGLSDALDEENLDAEDPRGISFDAEADEEGIVGRGGLAWSEAQISVANKIVSLKVTKTLREGLFQSPILGTPSGQLDYAHPENYIPLEEKEIIEFNRNTGVLLEGTTAKAAIDACQENTAACVDALLIKNDDSDTGTPGEGGCEGEEGTCNTAGNPAGSVLRGFLALLAALGARRRKS